MEIKPSAEDLWEGIGGHFDSFTQIICEFVDNAVANFSAHNPPCRNVNIKIATYQNEQIHVVIEDTGTGINDLAPVLRLGDRTVRESPLNEHGFGLKHALASASPRNRDWEIYTRTSEEFEKNEFKMVSAPYGFDIEVNKFDSGEKPWPGIYNGSGTIVAFNCSNTLFNTIQKGIRGKASLDRCLDYLVEDLGYIYSGIISSGKGSINVQSESGYSKPVPVIKPDWKATYKPGFGSQKLDLGDGEVQVEYKFGEIKDSDYIRYYKRNMSTSGVEIRINGRLLMSNIFKDIWEFENHPTYNRFLVQINLISEDRNKLPKTRTSKNGFRSGDEKLRNLFNWITQTCPKPPKVTAEAISERDLVKQLAIVKNQQIRSEDKCVETEFEVFTQIGSPVAVDLYMFDGKEVVLYEAKKNTADVQGIYQLLMYWDGAVSDSLKPSEGILLASDFSPGVDEVLKLVNSMKDQNGNNYNFSKKTWREESIDYPES